MNEYKEKKIKYCLKAFFQKYLFFDMFIFFEYAFVIKTIFIHNIIVDVFENKINKNEIAIFTKNVRSILNNINYFVSFCLHDFLSIFIFSNELFVFLFAKYRVDFSRNIDCSSIFEVILDIHRLNYKLTIFKQYKIVKKRFYYWFE